MKKHFRKVLEMLKTRKDVKALGFSRKELKGVAVKVTDKLQIPEEATEEEISEAIEDELDSIIPFLEISQAVVDRRIQSYKQSQSENDDDNDEDSDEEPDESETRRPSVKKGKAKEKENEPSQSNEVTKLFDKLNETIKGIKDEISELRTSKVADSRRSKLEELVKGTGKFGERALRAFDRMSFKTEEDFEDYFEEIQSDLEEENQDRSNKGLELLGKPVGAVPGKNKGQKEDEVMSDDEIKALAKG